MHPARFTIGDWTADPAVDELRSGDRVVKLEPRTMRVLATLAQSPGELVTTRALLDAVWPDVVVTTGSLYEAVAALRKVLGRDHIATVPRKGYRLPAPPALGPRSIAVLPFRMRGLPDDHAFIRDSLCDDLIAELSRLPGLVLVARGTMLAYARSDLPPQQAARQVGARWVVDGLIELRADTLHVGVHLVDVDLGTHSTTDAVELPLAAWPHAGVLVVGRLARALNLDIADLVVRQPLPVSGDADGDACSDEREALALATRAWVALFARAESRATTERAADWARQALAREPRLALAHTCLAFCHWRQAQFGWVDQPPHRVLLAQALEDAERGAELGPRDPDAHYVLGLISHACGQPARAEEALRHCIRLARSHAPAYGLLGLVRTRRGFPHETAALCDQAFALSPREPLRVVWHLANAWAALALQDFHGALDASQRGMAVNADFATCYVTGAVAAQALGQHDKAAAWVARLRERTVFDSLDAVRERLPPSTEPAYLLQLQQVVDSLRSAGLPERRGAAA